METLTIKTPADVLSFIGDTLGFWPEENLVCITLDTNHIGVPSAWTYPSTTATNSPVPEQPQGISPTTRMPLGLRNACWLLEHG